MQTLSKEEEGKNGHSLDYEAVAGSNKFKSLMKDKKKFLISLTVFFLVIYFSLPVLSAYSTVLNQPFIGDITWAWVLAFVQFVMTWALCTIYVRKAAHFDGAADEILAEHLNESGKNQ
ncbi:DUF485 domain-containing protein [Desmospora activa]|uniref:Uncharacterized membrane protein (DUF485 family) n=1 Tax=Desmospora activa DSM 45169 TaxID=1121389 RepID=A0A2T4ZCS8_9BACL|nr:DUF485 domain-containing protein [Desmospora activa]PTM59662.1 uncharacterized membrane protein (DUF485 family) [Desmospora activa DSM 45169]